MCLQEPGAFSWASINFSSSVDKTTTLDGFTGAKEALFQPRGSLRSEFSAPHISQEPPAALYSYSGSRVLLENIEAQLFSGISCCLSVNVTRYLAADTNSAGTRPRPRKTAHREQQRWARACPPDVGDK